MKFGMGQSVTRKEDARFLTGTGRYTDDIDLPGQAHAVLVRSTVAAGRITRLDAAAARRAPGVLAVYTQDDLVADKVNPLPCLVPMKKLDGSDRAETPRHALSKGRVRYVGDPVALVVAETLAQARDAAELVDVDVDELPSCTDPHQATDPGQPLVWDEAPNNLCYDWENGDRKGTDAAFAGAKHVVPFELVNNRVVVNAMEPRGVVADYDAGADVMTIHTCNQGANGMHGILANMVFGVAPEKLVVRVPDVGGGFGMKIFLYHEQVLCLFAARKLRRPVKWTSERAEGFLSDTQGRDNLTRGEIALDETGRILGLRVHTVANMGAYLSNFAPFIPTMAGTRVLGGVYDIPHAYAKITAVLTNTVPIDAYRGAGRPENIYITERAIDHAAAALKIDPAELRRRNYIRPEQMPYKTQMNETIDSGKFADNLDAAMRKADVAGFEARRKASEAAGRLRGLGIISYMEATAGAPQEHAEIIFEEDGTVTALVGTQSNGQGHETAFAQVLSEKLGVDFEKINVVMGDSARIKSGGGTGGSRSLIAEGSALTLAADKVIDKGRRIAGQLLEAAVEDIEFGDGAFRVAGTDRVKTIFEVADAARQPSLLPDGMEPGLDQEGDWEGTCTTFPNGCHICEVEVDRDTGQVQIVGYTVVDDFGRLVNPMLVAGQVHGGIAQGAGQALYENCVYDPDSGQLLSGSFMDYAMPRADHLPSIDISFNQTAPTTNNDLGIKGCGEAGTVGAAPAVISAVCNALGVVHIDMPATPERVWRALEAAKAA
jgi:carbon-monoxide dehydrogenase large subunit